MDLKKLLILTLSIIDETGEYISRTESRDTGAAATADMVYRVAEQMTDIPDDIVNKYGKQADDIADWIVHGKLNNDDYLITCRRSIDLLDTEPHKAIAYIVSLPNAYKRFNDNIIASSLITRPQEVYGRKYQKIKDHECTLIRITPISKFQYTKLFCVDNDGYLFVVNYSDESKNNIVPLLNVDDKILISGTINKYAIRNIFETILSRATIKKV